MKNKIGFIITMIIVMLIGLAILSFGIGNLKRVKDETKEYISVEGVFCDYRVYSHSENGKTYSLEYEYIVDGQKYYISTDYGTGIIPKEGSTKTIKYDPENPDIAIIEGFGSNTLVLLLGFMFFFIPLLMLISSGDDESKNEKIKKYKSTITSFLLGITFGGIGVGVYYLMCSGADDLSLASAFQTVGILIIVPILFMALGIYAIFSTLFVKREKEVILNVEEIVECEDGSYSIILSDINISDGDFKAALYKYYIYNTKNKEIFQKDKKIKLNIYKYGIMFQLVYLSDKIQARNLKMFIDTDFEETIV